VALEQRSSQDLRLTAKGEAGLLLSSAATAAISPEQILAQLSSSEQIRLIMSHPFFTGRCPQCRQSIQIAKAALGKCTCDHCGWADKIEL
jgi:hypothetical protein